MKKIIITLSLAVLVFVITLSVTNSYISNKSVQASDNMVVQKMDAFCSKFDGDLLMTRNAVFGFLTGVLIYNKERNADCFYVDDNNIEDFQNDIKRHLGTFLNANPYYESAMFIIEKKSAAPPTKESYYAPTLVKGSDKIIDYAVKYDFTNVKGFQICKQSLKPYWNLPTTMSEKVIICFFVPICRKSDGSFFGTFSISLNITTIDKEIERHLPFGIHESEMMITDQHGNIITSCPAVYKEFKTYDKLLEHTEGSYDVIDDSLNNRKIVVCGGKEYFHYEHNLKYAPWKIITGCTADAVYAVANDMKRVILVTSFIGMLLMLVTCVVVMLQIRATHRRKEMAERELNMASKVQMSLLRNPRYETSAVSLSAYLQPARRAGGDLYDYVRVDDKLVFCIGDVSGKGMPAALFMTQVMSLFRSAVKRSSDPSFILSYINEVMADDNPDMTFCTLFIGVLEGSTLTFANAGHDNPLLLQSSSHSLPTPVILPSDSNIPIGIEADIPYVTETYTMQHGDAIVLYTDGITEAKNKMLQLYGEQRMIEALSSRSSNDPQHCTSHLLTSVRTFVCGAEQSDDITIMTILNK